MEGERRPLQDVTCYKVSDPVQLTRRYFVVIQLQTIVQCHYNMVNFLSNPHKIHPIARPLGQGMECILWVETRIYTLSQSLQ